ncbi:uncharacterized protein BO80DRAFT_429041 [Aspergillus ibericus CBS 121593]|uniref:Fungal-type protein kinase domain-containing protein n=1 Tax=Aspergillus ibericus CBS 121593 TaxID=1448316 RepID=A0A395GM10_9EURO|nr:hypothetical protein BO80DRAFT_429041 [Aspergillus ibericus CBS 121593]RAK96509.1 hypothetical protein BO80DRAFT_429041 [Aspergillus ibericus CBS 121593]
MSTSSPSAFSRHVALSSALSAVTPHSTESSVSILWTNICIAFFPLESGFKFCSKQTVRRQDMDVDYVIFQMSLVVPSIPDPQDAPSFTENDILIVQCKRPSKDTPDEWESARLQLAQHCEGNTNPTRRIFGATAIGTKVKFWRYEHPTLAPLFPKVDTYDLLEGHSGYQAEQCLEYMRDNGWNWIQSPMRA